MSEIIPGMISVIVPTYNRREMLLELIQTIRQQDYPLLELLVVDDGSTDGTDNAMAASETPVRYFRNEHNSGPGYSRKRGFREARGEYIVFADDDDYYTDAHFYAKAVEILRADKTHALSFAAANARILYVDTGEYKDAVLPMEGRVTAADYLADFSVGMPKPLSTFPAVFRREALERSDLEQSQQVDDRVIYLRSLLSGDAWILRDTVGVYRIHSSNFSSTVSAEFTITLHRENRMIYDEICRRRLLEAPKDWWYTQAWIALRFYILNPRADWRGLCKVFRFLRGQKLSLSRDLKLFRQAGGYWYMRHKKQ